MSFDGNRTYTTHSGGETSYRGGPAWQLRGICAQEADPDLFFPVGNTGPALLQIEEAKAVCRRCPVMETCGDYAMDSGQESGVWGGLSEDERRAIKRREARKRAAKTASKQKAGAQR